MISHQLGIPVFDTDSVSTGDPDEDTISITEIIRRYGEGESYIHFLAPHIKNALSGTDDLILLDSLKIPADPQVVREYFPNSDIHLLWVHSPFGIRHSRYLVRDISSGKRTQTLSDHDAELLKIGILELFMAADFIVSNVFDESKLFSDVSYIVDHLRT